MRARDTAVNAVSELEKNPDNATNIKMANIGPHIDQSIVFKNSILIPLLSIFGIFIVMTLIKTGKEKQMKSLLIGIILFAILVIGGMIALSFMDIDVPQNEMTVAITPTTPAAAE